MVESVGKKLNQARLRRGLSVEEVAHATKLRPDKVLALEADDYTPFPSNAYAKGFLQIYAKYLRVDVSHYLPVFENSNAISVEDYQYLNNAPVAKSSAPVRIERRPPSIAPLVFFVLLVVAGLGTYWFVVNYQRTVPSAKTQNEESAAGGGSSGEPRASATGGGVRPPASAAGGKTPETIGSPGTPAPASPERGGSLKPGAPVVQNGEGAGSAPPVVASGAVTDRDFVTPTAVPSPDSLAGSAARNGLNEVGVTSVKKTWVIIRKDDPKAEPYWEDYLYPNEHLKLKGARFFIDARDPSAVQITKNGLPFAYQDPNVPVQ